MYAGDVDIAPPFVPTEIGISILPIKISPSILYDVNGLYFPEKEAKECAELSIALKS
jgi:hypothetical protein